MKTTILILLAVSLFAGCVKKDKEQQAIDEAIAKIDAQHKAFGANYNADTTSVTMQMTFKVEGGQILPKPTKTEIVFARMPYQPVPGTFLLLQLDSQRKAIGTIAIENPLIIRSCDEAGKPSVSVMSTGSVSFRVPYSPKAVYLQMRDSTMKGFRATEVELVPIHKQLKLQ